MEQTIIKTTDLKEYHRIWKKNNSEKVKGYRKKYYENNKDYFKNYYKEKKEIILENARRWREKNEKMDAVYFFINNEGENFYIGSSSIFETRMSAHCTSNSNLHMTAEEMVSDSDINLSTILYKDFTSYNLSRDDLYFLERWYKNNTKELRKTNQVYYKEENLTRSKEELIDLAENQVEYKEFEKLDRYLY